MPDVLAFVVRASFTYLFLLLVLRLAGKRTVGEATPFDLIVALVLGDLPDDLIWGEVTVPVAITAIGTLVLLHMAVAAACYRWPPFERLVASVPRVVVERGRIVPDAARAERLNDGDLDWELRELGVFARTQVRRARLEPSGALSVERERSHRLARRADVA